MSNEVVPEGAGHPDCVQEVEYPGGMIRRQSSIPKVLLAPNDAGLKLVGQSEPSDEKRKTCQCPQGCRIIRIVLEVGKRLRARMKLDGGQVDAGSCECRFVGLPSRSV